VVDTALADRVRAGYQTGDTESATRRDSPRRNTGRKEREGAGVAGSSAVDSRAGVDLTRPAAADAVVARGWSMVDVDTRLSSLPLSIVGGVVVIRSREV
jgi:hypothetical protein